MKNFITFETRMSYSRTLYQPEEMFCTFGLRKGSRREIERRNSWGNSSPLSGLNHGIFIKMKYCLSSVSRRLHSKRFKIKY